MKLRPGNYLVKLDNCWYMATATNGGETLTFYRPHYDDITLLVNRLNIECISAPFAITEEDRLDGTKGNYIGFIRPNGDPSISITLNPTGT